MDRKTFIPFDQTVDNSIDFMLGIFEDARITTLQRIEKLSVEALHWQVAEGWNTISALLEHIVSAEKYFRIAFIGEREPTKEEKEDIIPGLEMGKYIPQLISDQPVAYYMDKLASSRAALLEAMKGVTKESFHRKRKGYHPETGFNLAWALYHLAEDEVHHRGQISIIHKLYLKQKTEI